MLRSLLLRSRPEGQRYDGPATYVDGNGHPAIRAGYYAMTRDGRKLRRPYVRLCAVTHADGSHHYEIVRKSGSHQRPFAGPVAAAPRTVELELEAEGHGDVAPAAPVDTNDRCPRCDTRMIEGACPECGHKL
jgi:hypothetical protein